MPELTENCKHRSILLRPTDNAHGLWMCCLLTLAYFVNQFRFSGSGGDGNDVGVGTISFQYNLSTILSFGLLLQSIKIYQQLKYPTTKQWSIFSLLLNLFPGCLISFLVWICLKQGIWFSLITGCLTLIGYEHIFIQLLRALPNSFTLGEATVVGQGVTLVLINGVMQLFILSPSSSTNLLTTSQKDIQIMSSLLLVTFIGTVGIILFTFLINGLRGIKFYIFFITMVAGIMFYPIADGDFAVLIVLKYIFAKSERMIALAGSVCLIVLTLLITIWYMSTGNKTSTRIRKLFHIFIILVYIPGIINQCVLLFISSAMLLAIFVLLETFRLIKLPPVHLILENAVSTFIDEQDSGLIALTPIYLLIGCTLPFWLHPIGCDDSFKMKIPLMAGVFSVGIGDAVASVCGSWFGTHKWSNDDAKSKTIEGTICNILSQIIVLQILCYYDLKLTTIELIIFIVAICVNALVEAKTKQIDNLVLPLITFIILALI